MPQAAGEGRDGDEHAPRFTGAYGAELASGRGTLRDESAGAAKLG